MDDMLLLVLGVVVSIGGTFAYLLTPPKARTVRKPSATADPSSRPGLAKSVAKDAPRTGKRYVVVGTGNVGMTLVEALIERGETNVVGFDITAPRRTPAKHFAYVKGDVTDYESVRQALVGADVVYATWAVIRYQERLPHDYAFSHKVNVTGTENVIRACVANGVQLLVQTSTSHVVMTPRVHDRMDLDESAEYCTAETAENHYAWTKAQAEKLVLAANGTPLPSGGKLLTVALRPCSGIFGAMDQLITELTLKNFKTKGAEMVTATGTIDWIYVEDLVYAELLGERKLLDTPDAVAGQAFCICPEEPISGYDFNLALQFYYQLLTKRKVQVTLAPIRLLYVLAHGVETYARLTHKKVAGELGMLTPCMLDCATITYGFKATRARNVLGYKPIYTFDEAMRHNVAAWLQLFDNQ